VLYAGENDIAAGKSPEQVAGDFARFVDVVRVELPRTKTVFIGLKPSPLRWKLIEQFRRTNELIRVEIEKRENVVFVDVERRMLGDDGTPRAELFLPDRLHLNRAGYELWTELLLPHLGER
jgi:lysophospholipase L1-like esterase